jgi:hypothetical protein
MPLSIPSLILACIALLELSSTAPLSQRSSEFGPHITTDFPDPSILRVGETWYAFAGQSLYDYKSTHIQLAISTDFKTWTLQPGIDMLPALPSWVDAFKDHVWAPDINHLACVLKVSFASRLLTRYRTMADSSYTSALRPITPALPTVLALRSVTQYTAPIYHPKKVLPVLMTKEVPSMHLAFETAMGLDTLYTSSIATPLALAAPATMESSRSSPLPSSFRKSQVME